MVLIVFREIWNGPNAVNRWRDGNPCLVNSDIYETHGLNPQAGCTQKLYISDLDDFFTG